MRTLYLMLWLIFLPWLYLKDIQVEKVCVDQVNLIDNIEGGLSENTECRLQKWHPVC
jgi:hypothetical protein